MATAAAPPVTPTPLKDLLPGVTARLASGTWIRLLGFDAGRQKAQLDMVRRTDTCAVGGTCDARQPAVVAEPPAEVAGWLAARQAQRTADATARRALVKGARVEWANAGKTYVGTLLRVSKLTAAVRGDDGNEWKCGLGALRPSTVAPPAALPPHPTMARWSLGKVKWGLVGNEGRSWEQPLLCDGKRIGYLRDDASGGSVDIDIDWKLPNRHDLEKAFCADANKWAAAVGDPDLVEAYSSWAEWETNERPLGMAYRTLEQRYPELAAKS